MARFASACWYLIVGDDWRVALAVVAALALTSALSATGVDAWWMVPAVVAVLLALGPVRVIRARDGAERSDSGPA